ncbi:MAG: recombinase family protein [Phycisphaerales bacterium]
MKAAIYARYSGDRQRETSIEDQSRNCRRYTDREGCTVVRVYEDKAISGSTSARPEYQAMLTDATAGAFCVLVVDDLSRLSRDDYEMKGLLRKLAWQGIRVVSVSDGYDSERKGHKIHAGFKGLMNELFLDDLRERTHRGMTGQALKGFNCGGRTYGYRNVAIEDSTRKDAYGRAAIAAVRYEVHDEQADTVRQIFAWYAEGRSYKWIASELNRRKVPSSRGSTWALSAIKVVLDNEMYEGRVIWNRRHWRKHPDTGRRTYRERPRDEWIVHEAPELRIVPIDVIDAVRRRQRDRRCKYEDGYKASSAQRYLFSGLLVCATCGGSFVIVSGSRYGCAQHKTRGASVCSNGATVSRRLVESHLLRDIRTRMLSPDGVEAYARFASSILKRHQDSARSNDLKRQLESADRARLNILEGIKRGIITATTREALEAAEKEVEDLRVRAAAMPQWDIAALLPQVLQRYQEAVARLEERIVDHIDAARDILRQLLGSPIRIHARGDYCEAEIPSGLPSILSMSLNSNVDLLGCGGVIRTESHFVPLRDAQTRSE